MIRFYEMKIFDSSTKRLSRGVRVGEQFPEHISTGSSIFYPSSGTPPAWLQTETPVDPASCDGPGLRLDGHMAQRRQTNSKQSSHSNPDQQRVLNPTGGLPHGPHLMVFNEGHEDQIQHSELGNRAIEHRATPGNWADL